MRRVLITGGSSGIGLACARRLAADGASVALLARPGVAMVHTGPVESPFWRRARTVDRRRPAKVRGAYTADDVAAGSSAPWTARVPSRTSA